MVSENHAIKKYIVLLLLSLTMLINIIPINAQNTSKVVRVGYYLNDGFQEYDEKTGTYSGYSYEFLRALQQYTDWSYEFIPVSFTEGLKMLENGEIDLMNNVSKTVERQEVLGFSDLNSGQNIAYLAMKCGDSRVALNDLKAIESIKIGLAKDSIYTQKLIDYFNQENVQANIIFYNNHDEVSNAFNNEEVDAYVITSSIRSDEHIILSFAPDLYYIATAKANKKLINEIDNAITSLRANDPYFELHLKEKYYGQASENYTVLTSEENEFIKDNPIIKVLCQPNWYPMCYRDEDGKISGAIKSVYDLIEQRTGLKFEYVEADEDKDDMLDLYNASILMEQPNDFSGADKYNVKLTSPIVEPPLIEVANHVLKSGDTLSLVKGDYLSDIVQNIYGDEFIYKFYDSVDECINAIGDKVDGTVLIYYEGEYYRQSIKYSNLKYTIVDEGSYSLSIAVSNDADYRLYNIIQKGLNSISNGEITNVFNETLLSLQKNDINTMIHRNPIPSIIIITIIFSMFIIMIMGYLFICKLKKQNLIINQKNNELALANKATTDFFSRMSHDMRTPMNGILGIANLSEDENEILVLKQNISKIEKSGEYLLSLINDTLDFQKIESGQMQLKKDIVYSNDLFENIKDMVKSSIDGKNINLKINNKNINLDDYILVDALRIKQIFINLISNAIKFTPNKGTILIELECIEKKDNISYNCFKISDTGIGMSKDFISNNLFKPFTQELNEVTNDYGGSGLGLSIVKSLITLMNGKIVVESEVKEGTTFTIYLNIEHVSKKELDNTLIEKETKTNIAIERLQDKQILLVEDHPLNAEITCRLLNKVGCHVTWVKDGQEGVDMFFKQPINTFDLILMDIRMPRLNGLEATKAIRAMDKEDALIIPIIAMSANAYQEDKDKSIEVGMNDHLAKPINPNELYETMAKFILINK